jgi:hypothetical protein
VAKSGEKEIVIGIPEDKVDSLRRVPDVQVRLWADPKIRWRARSAKFRRWPIRHPHLHRQGVDSRSLADAKLGMTAVVQFASKTPVPQIKVPLTALFYESRHLGVDGGAGPSSWCR